MVESSLSFRLRTFKPRNKCVIGAEAVPCVGSKRTSVLGIFFQIE